MSAQHPWLTRPRLIRGGLLALIVLGAILIAYPQITAAAPVLTITIKNTDATNPDATKVGDQVAYYDKDTEYQDTYWLQVEVCETGGVDGATNVQVTLDPAAFPIFDGTVGHDEFELGYNEVSTQVVETIAAGTCQQVYWFVNIPEDAAAPINQVFEQAYTVNLTTDQGSTASASGSLRVEPSFTTNSSGDIMAITLGTPPIYVNDTFYVTVDFEAGNVGDSGDFLFLPTSRIPAGLPFDPSLFELVGTTGTATCTGGAGTVTHDLTDRFYVDNASPGAPRTCGGTIVLEFKAVLPGTTILYPNATADSGTGFKYRQPTQLTVPSIEVSTLPALVVTKADTPDNDPALPGDTITYTISLTNLSLQAAIEGVSFTDTVSDANLLWVGNVTCLAVCGSFVDNSVPATKTVDVDFGDIPANSTAIFTFQMQVDPNLINPAVTSVQNQGLATTTDGNPDTLSNDPDTLTDDDPTVTPVEVPEFDLAVVKTDSADPVNLGDDVTYNVAVTNNGPDTAREVVVTDTLPGSVTFVSAVPDDGGACVESGGVVTCTLNDIASGNTVNISIVVTPAASGTITNSASASAAGIDTEASNDSDSEDTLIAAADLSLTKTDAADPVTVGDDITYTLTVTNSGPGPASDVTLADTLPAGVVFVSATPDQGTCGEAGGVVTCDLGTVNNGASVDVLIVVTANASGTLTNNASVTASTPDPDNSDNDASQDTTVTQADLDLTKLASDTTPKVGDTITFALTVTNNGPAAVTGIEVADALPAGFTYVSDDGGGAYNAGTGVWSVGALANGASASLTITVMVDAPTGTPGEYTNYAEITASSQFDPDSTPDNGSTTEDDDASVTITPQQADLDLTKLASDMTPDVGDTITFTLTVTNNGPDAAAGITVTDALPGGFTYVSDDGAGAYNPGTGVWTVGSLASGASASLTITVTVDAPTGTPGEYTNYSEVTASDQFDPDSTPGNGSTTEDDDASVTAAPQVADLSLSKIASDSTPEVGDTITFTLTLTNAGPATATNVTVSDLLPAGFTYVSDDGAGAYNSGTGVWTVASLAAGASTSLTITVTVDAPTGAAGEYTNYAQVAASDQFDPDSTPGDGSSGDDDDASQTISPVHADLQLAKTDALDPVTVGDDITYTLTVTNTGPGAAANVQVTDTLPGGVIFVSATPDQGTCGEAGGIVTCDLGTISNGASVDIVIVVTTTADGLLTNTATVTSDTFDPDDTDNDASQDTTVSPLAASADLSLTKTVNPVTANVSDSVTYTLTLTNGGPDTATTIEVTESLPANFTPTTITPGNTSVNNTPTIWTGATSLWEIPSLDPGETATLTITGTVDASGTISNSAEVTAADQADPDSTPGNADPAEDDQTSASVAVNVPSADLSIAKTVIGMSPATPTLGGTLDYQIVVTNNGPDDATGVVISDALPAELTGLVVLSATEGTYDGSTWGTLTIPAGGSDTLTFRVTINASGVTITNSAEVAAADQVDPDSTPNNGNPAEDDFDSVDVAVGSMADLSLGKSVSDATPNVGDTIQYTLTLTNSGPDDATGVAVADTLPAGIAYVGNVSVPGGTTFDGATWTVGMVGSGTTLTLVFEVQVTAATQQINVAEVTAANESDPDSTPNNGVIGEDDMGRVTVNPQQADLALDKSVDSPAPNVGDTVTFTLTVTNNGLSDATGVAVGDLLPAGFNYVSDDGGGAYNPSNGVWSINTLANGATATLNITATVLAPNPPLALPGSYTNAAEIIAADQFDPTSTPGNGSTTEDDDAATAALPQVADLSLTKLANTASVQVPGQVTYTISVTNSGPADATGVTVSEPLLAGMSFVAAQITGGGNYDPDTGIWDIGTLVNGSTAILQLTVSLTAAGSYDNVAEIASADQFDPDSLPANGSLAEDDRGGQSVMANSPGGGGSGGGGDDEEESQPAIQAGDPAISKAGSPQAATIGEHVTWTVQVWNPGNVPTNPVVFSDTLPDMFTIVNVTTTKGTVTVSGNSVTVDIGVLQPGEMVSITIDALANTLAQSGEVCNLAFANSASARACVTVFPEELPPTGGRPLSASRVVALLVLGGLLGLAAVTVWGRFPTRSRIG